MKGWRAFGLVALLACLHLATTFTVGVLSFTAQPNLTQLPAEPSTAYVLLSSAAAVLEFPLVWLVRRASPERLAGFTLAAVSNSVLWAGVAYAAVFAATRKWSSS